MAEKRRFLDVWIVEGNTVYREVPFTVVADWVQQGRLLEDDMLRPSGTKDWFRVGGNPTFAAYLPKSEPYRAEDKAEALEPVQLELAWKRRPETDPDEDVDMIPLIDVSLVLLIFFMMISVGVISGKDINVSPAQNGDVVDPRTVWVGIEQGDGGPIYSFGIGAQIMTLADGSGQTTTDRAELLRSLDGLLEKKPEGTEVRIRAHQDVVCDPVMEMVALLQARRPKVGQIHKDVKGAR